MAKSENVIRIPKPPAEAYNKHRPVSDLLWTQVEHLAAVVKKDIDDECRAMKKDIDKERRAIRTEGQASAFIKKYTAILHPQGASKKPAPSSKGTKKTASSKSAKKKPSRSPKG
jgi:hypothetical protein